MGTALCSYVRCPRHNDCYRFMAEDRDPNLIMDFQYICYKENGYKYHYDIGEKPVRKEALPNV